MIPRYFNICTRFLSYCQHTSNQPRPKKRIIKILHITPYNALEYLCSGTHCRTTLVQINGVRLSFAGILRADMVTGWKYERDIELRCPISDSFMKSCCKKVVVNQLLCTFALNTVRL